MVAWAWWSNSVTMTWTYTRLCWCNDCWYDDHLVSCIQEMGSCWWLPGCGCGSWVRWPPCCCSLRTVSPCSCSSHPDTTRINHHNHDDDTDLCELKTTSDGSWGLWHNPGTQWEPVSSTSQHRVWSVTWVVAGARLGRHCVGRSKACHGEHAWSSEAVAWSPPIVRRPWSWSRGLEPWPHQWQGTVGGGGGGVSVSPSAVQRRAGNLSQRWLICRLIRWLPHCHGSCMQPRLMRELCAQSGGEEEDSVQVPCIHCSCSLVQTPGTGGTDIAGLDSWHHCASQHWNIVLYSLYSLMCSNKFNSLHFVALLFGGKHA